MLDISISSSREIKPRAYWAQGGYVCRGRPKGRPGRLLKNSVFHWPNKDIIVVTEYASPGIIGLN